MPSFLLLFFLFCTKYIEPIHVCQRPTLIISWSKVNLFPFNYAVLGQTKKKTVILRDLVSAEQ